MGAAKRYERRCVCCDEKFAVCWVVPVCKDKGGRDTHQVHVVAISVNIFSSRIKTKLQKVFKEVLSVKI